MNREESMTAHSIRTASVMYYSQTGHTKQYARYIASILERNGLAVHTFDLSLIHISEPTRPY